MRIPVTFPGGARVEAQVGDYRIATDQPVAAGGGGTAAAPFELFLASIATCAGIYALRFCQVRSLATAGLALAVEVEPTADGKAVAELRLQLTLPVGFPERYREAIAHAIDQCKVKRHLAAPPRFTLELTPADAAAGAATPA